MSNLFASVFTGFGAFFAGIFGGGHAATNPVMHPAPNGNAPWTASTTAMHGNMMRNGVFGIVESTDDTNLTVAGREGTSTGTTTFAVDASNAKIIKGSASTTASISDVLVGDRVIVEGPVTGDSVIATVIIDGRVSGMMGGRGFGQPGMASSTPPLPGQGNINRMPRGMRGQYDQSGGGNPGTSAGGVYPGGPMQSRITPINQGNPQNVPGGGGQNGGPGQQ